MSFEHLPAAERDNIFYKSLLRTAHRLHSDKDDFDPEDIVSGSYVQARGTNPEAEGWFPLKYMRLVMRGWVYHQRRMRYGTDRKISGVPISLDVPATGSADADFTIGDVIPDDCDVEDAVITRVEVEKALDLLTAEERYLMTSLEAGYSYGDLSVALHIAPATLRRKVKVLRDRVAGKDRPRAGRIGVVNSSHNTLSTFFAAD